MPPFFYFYELFYGKIRADKKGEGMEQGGISQGVAESFGPLLVKEAEQLAKEKNLPNQVVFSCLQKAFEKVAQDTYGQGRDIRAHIHVHTGVIQITCHRRVVEKVDDPLQEVTKEEFPHVETGQEVVDPLPLPQFTRVIVQTLKSTLVKSIQEIEKSMEYEEYKDRVGQVVSGLVKQVEGGDLILDIGRATGIIHRNELIPQETYRSGDRVKAYIYAVRQEIRGPQVFLSRTHPGFLAKLFAQEVPEIYDGVIEIKAVARDPGSRAKIAVASRDERSFDFIGACVGVRGNRVNAVSQELQGEKVDIIPWSPDLPVFVVNALTPAEVAKVVVEKKTHIRVVVPDHQQSIAIGRRGQNVRLAHQLTGVNIEIVTESTDSAHASRARQEIANLFVEKLDLDEMMAHFLVSEGFENVEELAQSSLRELSELRGITKEVAQELKERAQEAALEEQRSLSAAFLESGGDEAVIALGFPVFSLSCLLAHKVISLKDVADLSLDELLDVLGSKKDLLPEKEWGALILKARLL